MNARDVARRVLAARRRGRLRDARAGRRARARARPASADRGLATELVYGVLKRRRAPRLRARRVRAARPRRARRRACSTRCASAPTRSCSCACRPTPPSTTRSRRSSARAAQKLAGFANALLRALARDGEPPPPTAPLRAPRRRASRRPTGWSTTRSPASAPTRRARFLAALNAPAPLWLRANTLARHARRGDGRASPPSGRDATLTPSARRARGACASTAPATVAQLDAFARRPGDRAGRRPRSSSARLVDPRAGRAHPRRLRRRRRQVDAPGRARRRRRAHRRRRPLASASSSSAADLARRLGVTLDDADRAAISPTAGAPLAAELRPRAPRRAVHRARRPAPPSRGQVAPHARRRRRARRAAGASCSTRWRRACARAACSSTRCARSPTRRAPRSSRASSARTRDFRVEGEPLRTWPHRDDADGFFAVRLRARGTVESRA